MDDFETNQEWQVVQASISWPEDIASDGQHFDKGSKKASNGSAAAFEATMQGRIKTATAGSRRSTAGNDERSGCRWTSTALS